MLQKLFILPLIALALSSCNSNSENKDLNNNSFTGAHTTDDSIKIISKQIDEQDLNPVLYMERSKKYSHENRLELSIRDAEHAISIDSTKANWYVYLSDLYMQRPYVKGALLCLEQAVKLNPEDTSLYLRLGKMFFEVKNREKSFQYLNQALKLDPNNADAFFYRGYNYREMNKPAKAVENFQHVIELDPQYFDAYMQLGILHADLKDKKAEAYYNSALTIKPNNPRALYARGMYYQQIDSNKKAIEDFKKILTIDPNNKAVNYNLGYNYILLKDYQNSAQYFTAAINADPNYAEAYEGRGDAYEMLGQKEKAFDDLQHFNELKEKEKKDKK